MLAKALVKVGQANQTAFQRAGDDRSTRLEKLLSIPGSRSTSSRRDRIDPPSHLRELAWMHEARAAKSMRGTRPCAR